MKKHIEIVFDQSVKGTEGKFCSLPFKNHSIVKISQKNNFIFTIYSSNNDVKDGTIYLPFKFCEFNGIEEGGANI